MIAEHDRAAAIASDLHGCASLFGKWSSVDCCGERDLPKVDLLGRNAETLRLDSAEAHQVADDAQHPAGFAVD